MATLERPRIGLNAHLLNLAGNYRSAGINWYIYHLLKHLDPSEFEYRVFLSESRARPDLPALELVVSSFPTRNPLVRIAWEQTVLPQLLRKENIRLFHGMAFAGPLAISVPWVTTIFDLSFIHFPTLFNRANRLYLKWAVGDSARRASRLIAISESTKQDLVRIYRVNPDKVAVIHCGQDEDGTGQDTLDRAAGFRERHHLDRPYVLHVGTIEPRKNIVRLLRAFAEAKRNGRLAHMLVLVGARGWKYTQVDQVIEDEGLAEHVRFAGYVPQDELSLWYRGADLFVYPSLYEGFGLPLLEAMSNQVPVVASNSSSLPEVVGDAALVVSPTDESALAEAIVRALTDQPLRNQLVERGMRRAKCFSWERAAQETAQVYTDVLNAGGSRATA